MRNWGAEFPSVCAVRVLLINVRQLVEFHFLCECSKLPHCNLRNKNFLRNVTETGYTAFSQHFLMINPAHIMYKKKKTTRVKIQFLYASACSPASCKQTGVANNLEIQWLFKNNSLAKQVLSSGCASTSCLYVVAGENSLKLSLMTYISLVLSRAYLRVQ